MKTFRRRQMQASQAVDAGDGVFLPTTYQRVEYIQGDGDAYIDLGINNESTFGVRAKISGDFTCGTTNNAVQGIGIWYNAGWLYYRSYPGGGIYYYSEITDPSYVCANFNESGIGLVEGDENSQKTLEASSLGDSEYHFLLFAVNNYLGDVTYVKDGKLYHFQLSDGSTLAMDLYPCYRKNDNTPGLYDIVTKQFFPNAAQSGAFTVGGDITTKSPYIIFADPVAEQLCASNWGDGIGITKIQASSVTNIDNVFISNSDVTSFNEFKYFTGVGRMWYGALYNCPNLGEITIPDTSSIYCDDALVFSSNDVPFVVNLSRIELWFEMISRSANSVVLNNGQSFDLHFEGRRIENVTVPAAYTQYPIFASCKYIKEITVQSGATVIGDSFAVTTTMLEKINLPSSITSIGNYAFMDCGYNNTVSKRTRLNLPNLLSLGGAAFFTCDCIGEFANLGHITEIGTWTFLYAKFNRLVLPASLLSVTGDRSLCSYRTNRKAELISLATTPPSLAAGTYDGSQTYRIVYVPYGCSQAYKSAPVWSDYPNIIYELGQNGELPIYFEDDNVRQVCATSFGDGNGITPTQAAAVTTNQMTTLFQNNTSITSFNEFQYFTGIVSLSGDTFSGSSLTEITFPTSLKNMGFGTFRSLTNPVEITFLAPVDGSLDAPFYDSKIVRINLPSMDTWYQMSSHAFTSDFSRSNNDTLLYVNGERVYDIIVPESVTDFTHISFFGMNIRNLQISSTATAYNSSLFGKCGNGTGTLILLSDTTFTTNPYSQNSDFKYYVFYGDFDKRITGVTAKTNCEGLWFKKNLILTESYGLNYTYDQTSSLKFVEVMGTVSSPNRYGMFAYDDGQNLADGLILHLGYNGIACFADIACASFTRISKIYVGEGVTENGDQAVLNQYLSDSNWTQYSSKLDLWYNYNGEYKTTPTISDT